MKKYIYIPVNSLNINNILSSESISPSSFYDKRGFGFKRFEKLTSCPFNHIYLGYDAIPLLPEERSDREEYPIYIAFPSSYLQNQREDKKYENRTISLINSTVYLNSIECFFIVRTNDEKKKLIASSRRSLEAKNSEAYFRDLVTLENYDIESFNWNESIIDSIRDEKYHNNDSLKKDQKINKLKGFLYGFVSGELKEEPNELTRGKRYFQEFVNTYSVLMNELSLISKNYGNSKSNFKPRVKSEIDNLIHLKERISILFGGNEVEELNKEIRGSFKLDESDLIKYKATKYNKSRISVYSLISEFVKNKNKNLYSVDELLESLIVRVKSYLNYRNENSYKQLEDLYSSIRVAIQSKINEYESQSIQDNSIENLPFDIKSNFYIKSKIRETKEIENRDYDIVINELLSRIELSSSDEIAQERINIVENVGKCLLDIFGDKEKPELKYLRKFHKSIKTVGVGFKLGEIDNEALQAMVCFLSRYSQLDKFQDFMEKNNYSNYSLAYGCWGAGYGYANLSKIMIKPIISHVDAYKVLNEFIFNLCYNQKLDYTIKMNFINSKKNEKRIKSEPITYKWNYTKKDKSKESSLQYKSSAEESFYSLLKQNKLLGKNEDWVQVLDECYKNIINESNGPMFNTNNYRLVQFKRLLRDKKNILKRFGDAKEKEAIKVFKEFLSKNE